MQAMKTIKLKLYRPSRIKQRLLSLLHENQRLLNEYVELIEKHNTTSRKALHKLTYHNLRSAYKLPSAILQSARDKAIEAYKGYIVKKFRNKKTSKPCFRKYAPVRLDRRTFSVIETPNKFRYFASITTCTGRIFVPLLGQRYQYRYLVKLFQHKLSQGTAELVKKDSEFYIYLTVKREVTVPDPGKTSTPIGVDLGINNLSTSVILGERPCRVRFFSGKPALGMRRHFSAFRASLGKAKKLWRIKATRDKESRCMQDINHKISSSIIKQALTVKSPVIVLERLKYIRRNLRARKNQNRMLHSWAFAQLQHFIEYKARWNNIPVVYVKPDYTSQRCNACGYTDRANRKARAFKCRKCGYELNADLNAAINIAKQYKNFASGYMLGALGNVAMPLTPAVERVQASNPAYDRGSPRF